MTKHVGAALLVLRGWPLRWLLALQGAGLLLICVLVTNYDPVLWFHPFGPLTKNIPLIVGTMVLFRQAGDFSATDIAERRIPSLN